MACINFTAEHAIDLIKECFDCKGTADICGFDHTEAVISPEPLAELSV